MRELSMEIRNEIIDMTNNGHSVAEIHNVTKVSKGTIRKYQRLAESRSAENMERGGIVSRTIPVTHFAKKETVEEDDLAVILTDQQITITGALTSTKYRAGSGKDFVTIEGEGLVGEIKIEDIPKFADELRGVYNFATRMKCNKFDIVT